jgi:hypothetical protein
LPAYEGLTLSEVETQVYRNNQFIRFLGKDGHCTHFLEQNLVFDRVDLQLQNGIVLVAWRG